MKNKNLMKFWWFCNNFSKK